MNDPVQRVQRMLWLGVSLTALLLLLSFAASKIQRREAESLPIYGSVADFALTNQAGNRVTLQDLRGKVWVADIIFTRCPGPCLKMTRQMKELQEGLKADSRAHLVSLTTDAAFDTPPVLQQYAQRFGADPTRWTFLTGNPTQIAALAIDSLKLTAVEKRPEERTSPEDLFIHSTIFVLVDRQSRLRGVFETTGDNIDPAEVKRKILHAVRLLEKAP